MKNYEKKAVEKIYSATKTGHNLLRITGSLFLTVVQTTADLACPFFFVAALNDLNKIDENCDRLSPAARNIALYVTTSTISQVMTQWRKSILHSVGTELSYQLTMAVMQQSFDALMEFRISNTNAPAVQHFGSAYEHIGQAFVTNVFGATLPFFINYFATTLLIVYKYHDVVLPVLGLIFLHGVSSYVSATFVGKKQNQYVNTLFSGYENVIDKLDKYENAHFYNNVSEEMRYLSASLKTLNRDFVGSLSARSNTAACLTVLVGTGVGALLLCASRAFKEGNLTSDDLVILAFYSVSLANSMKGFSESLTALSGNYENFRSLLDYLDMPKTKGGQVLALSDSKQATIVFHDVGLRYEEKTIFRNLSFSVAPGDVIAIVGKSGAGKSTILRLLLRFYAPTTGTISVGGFDIANLDPSSLRKTFAIVPQSPNIFSGTLFDNIQYGDLSATREQVIAAGRKAGLSAMIDDRLDTDAGNAGGKFSGGQRQRIAIARAYLKESAKFLVLDEPTASLDVATEAVVLGAFNELIVAQEKPTIIITHGLDRLKKYIKVTRVIDLDDLAKATENCVSTDCNMRRRSSSSGLFLSRTTVGDDEQALSTRMKLD